MTRNAERLTPLQQMTERFYAHLTGRHLAAVVAAGRERGMSWRHLEQLLERHVDGQLELSGETLRRWYGAATSLTAADQFEELLRGIDAAIDAAADAEDWTEVARLRGEEQLLLAGEVVA